LACLDFVFVAHPQLERSGVEGRKGGDFLAHSWQGATFTGQGCAHTHAHSILLTLATNQSASRGSVLSSHRTVQFLFGAKRNF
jgi:hypothetical protein